jgi:putative oxidoreductase
MIDIDIASIVLRVAIGSTMVAHGWNHAFGGGRLPGTARWFESIGLQPGRIHALLATATELGAGAFILLGLLTPLAAGAVAGTMLVAAFANHWRNGFFIFRPGEGYEYVLFITLASVALGALGGGRVSLDNAAGLATALAGWTGLGITAGIGVAGSGILLGACYRPDRVPDTKPDPALG